MIRMGEKEEYEQDVSKEELGRNHRIVVSLGTGLLNPKSNPPNQRSSISWTGREIGVGAVIVERNLLEVK